MLLLAYETAHYGKEAILDDSSEDGEADDGQQEAAQDEGVDDGADGGEFDRSTLLSAIQRRAS